MATKADIDSLYTQITINCITQITEYINHCTNPNGNAHVVVTAEDAYAITGDFMEEFADNDIVGGYDIVLKDSTIDIKFYFHGYMDVVEKSGFIEIV